MENKEKILQKIKKCLAMAKSSNPHEAGVALGQAQKLMEAYGITQVDVEISNVFEEKTNKQATETRARWDWALANTVADAFLCDVLASCSYQNWKIYSQFKFIGVGASPELAVYTYNVLKRQLVKSRSEYLKIKLKNIVKKNKTARADQFCLGWVYAIKNQVKNFADNGQKEVIAKYVQTRYPTASKAKVVNRKVSKDTGMADLLNGVDAADGVQLFRPVNTKNNTALEVK